MDAAISLDVRGRTRPQFYCLLQCMVRTGGRMSERLDEVPTRTGRQMFRYMRSYKNTHQKSLFYHLVLRTQIK